MCSEWKVACHFLSPPAQPGVLSRDYSSGYYSWTAQALNEARWSKHRSAIEACCQTSSVPGRREGHRAPLDCLECGVNKRSKMRARQSVYLEWVGSGSRAELAKAISNILSSELCAHYAPVMWAGSLVFRTHRWLAPAMAHIYCLSSIPPRERVDVLLKDNYWSALQSV